MIKVTKDRQKEFSRDIAKNSDNWFLAMMGCFFALALIPMVLILSPDYFSTHRIVWIVIIPIFIIILPIIIRHFLSLQNKLRGNFWSELARDQSWIYEVGGDVSTETGLMFKEGHSRKANHTLKGNLDFSPFKIIDYQFFVNRGEAQIPFNFVSFIFNLNSQFPHCYLDKKENSYQIKGLGKSLSLPREFEKQFELWVPAGYEMEALQIFTLDLMANLLDFKLPYDIELVDQKLIIYVEGIVYGKQNFEKELDTAIKIKNIFLPKLEHFKFTPIKEHPSRLEKRQSII